MNKLIILIEFKLSSELTVKLHELGAELLNSVHDCATQSHYGPCWLGDDYQVYLMPENYDLGIDLDKPKEDEF